MAFWQLLKRRSHQYSSWQARWYFPYPHSAEWWLCTFYSVSIIIILFYSLEKVGNTLRSTEMLKILSMLKLYCMFWKTHGSFFMSTDATRRYNTARFMKVKTGMALQSHSSSIQHCRIWCFITLRTPSSCTMTCSTLPSSSLLVWPASVGLTLAGWRTN